MGSFISEYCPHCDAEVEWRAGVYARNTIGPASATCPGCGQAYATGRKEWGAMSPEEQHDYYRRVGWRCFVAFSFCVMGLMLAAFFATGAIFEVADPVILRYALLSSLACGLLLAGRVLQLALRQIKESVARDSRSDPSNR